MVQWSNGPTEFAQMYRSTVRTLFPTVQWFDGPKVFCYLGPWTIGAESFGPMLLWSRVGWVFGCFGTLTVGGRTIGRRALERGPPLDTRRRLFESIVCLGCARRCRVLPFSCDPS